MKKDIDALAVLFPQNLVSALLSLCHQPHEPRAGGNALVPEQKRTFPGKMIDQFVGVKPGRKDRPFCGVHTLRHENDVGDLRHVEIVLHMRLL